VYAAALERQVERFGNGEQFVSLFFDISGIPWYGGWGSGDVGAIHEGCKLAGRQRSADLSQWRAIDFMGYWRQRLSVALGRGRAHALQDTQLLTTDICAEVRSPRCRTWCGCTTCIILSSGYVCAKLGRIRVLEISASGSMRS
jgi:hypothetical protein